MLLKLIEEYGNSHSGKILLAMLSQGDIIAIEGCYYHANDLPCFLHDNPIQI